MTSSIGKPPRSDWHTRSYTRNTKTNTGTGTGTDTIMARHPLQRLAAPSRSFSALVHLIGLGSFSASFRYLRSFPNPLHLGFGGDYQFLTIIGLAVATATFAVGLLADLTLSPQLFAIKNVLSVCSAPLEVLVSVLYWGLCAIDRSLVVPPELALPLLPDWYVTDPISMLRAPMPASA